MKLKNKLFIICQKVDTRRVQVESDVSQQKNCFVLKFCAFFFFRYLYLLSSSCSNGDMDPFACSEQNQVYYQHTRTYILYNYARLLYCAKNTLAKIILVSIFVNQNKHTLAACHLPCCCSHVLLTNQHSNKALFTQRLHNLF